MIKIPDVIRRQDAIDEIEYELKMINSALDSITLDFNARERLRQRRGEAREILNSIQSLPSMQDEIASAVAVVIEQPPITRCKDCDRYHEPSCLMAYDGKEWSEDDGFCHAWERRTDEAD